MHFEFEHLGSTSHFELAPGQHQLGGGEGDAVRLEGLPAALLTLRVEGERLLVESTQPLSVDGVPLPCGVARLLLPGEVLWLPGEMRLRAVPGAAAERGVGTVALLRGLLADAAAAPPCRAASLTCLTGLDLGRSFPLAEAVLEVGRGERAQIRLRDRAMSRAHARLRRDGEGYCVQDLGSPNGLYLNGHRLRGEAALSDGDVLELGHSLLRYQAPLAEPAAPAAAPAADALAEPAAASDAPSEPMEPGEPVEARGEQGSRLEGWLVGLGAALALAGLAATWALTGG
ncbi:FHA domain-containing protein [Aggregicoccus sp. 17bor-14]|uniref:FHA domain-containing protein n=1 Tax=Myxococcaceae TaxID=31 RepID=UPI00129C9681|nr:MULTISPECIES: FHA domain-containing protein [Myxococcaceae]MBF5041469.1 FHA domain-containing protein [Simulacricoccus sp. 17bor-14]MRI87253.1 FHA domain-containing protein [Aggregicoccus sp. 17bor-14]